MGKPIPYKLPGGIQEPFKSFGGRGGARPGAGRPWGDYSVRHVVGTKVDEDTLALLTRKAQSMNASKAEIVRRALLIYLGVIKERRENE